MKRQFASALVVASLSLYTAKANPQELQPPPALPAWDAPDLGTVHGLFLACTDVKRAYFEGYCSGFINGVGDMMRWSTALAEKKGVRLNTNYCPPASVTKQELSEAFIIWHDQHAEHRQRSGPAVEGVMAALQGKWPCASSQE